MLKIIEDFEYPIYITFCITSICNSKCKHCSSSVAGKEDISTEKIIEVLKDLKKCGVFNLALSGGEPLLHPDFDLIAQTAVDLGLSTGVGTNGIVICEEVIEKIKQFKLDRVQISLDGSNAQTHDTFRGVQGMFKESIRAIEMLVKSGIKTNVCMTPTRLNYKELEEVIDMSYNLGVNGFNLSQFVPMGKGMEELDLNVDEWKNVMEIWYTKKQKYLGSMKFTSHEAQLVTIDKSYEDMAGFRGCQAGIGNVCILSDGTVLPCVMLYEPLGNVNNALFSEIWKNSNVVKDLKNRNKLLGKCERCKHIMKCGGCRAVALSKGGNIFASDPRCWVE